MLPDYHSCVSVTSFRQNQTAVSYQLDYATYELIISSTRIHIEFTTVQPQSRAIHRQKPCQSACSSRHPARP